MAAPTRDALQFPQSDSQHLDSYLPQWRAPSRPGSAFTKPFVTLTFATSLDSQLAIAPGVQTALSGPQSKAMTHYLRSRHDAILIGVGTAVADNPSLNCRIEGVGGYGGEGLEGQPRPVVIDPKGRWNFTAESKVMRLAKEGKGKAPWLVTEVDSSDEKRQLLEGLGGKVFKIPTMSSDASRSPSFLWSDIFGALYAEGIESVMVEGGGVVINDLLSPMNHKMIDAVIVTIAPTWLGRGGVQVCPDQHLVNGQRVPVGSLEDVRWVPLGDDVVLCGRPKLS
jgi:2,5-diamino-6-(ribosylamino)-4(3H)-pyrimidinone 5'-phosphate reductase